MEITKITVRKKEKEDSRLKAFISITLDNELAVHDIRVLQGDERLFIAMPSRKISVDKYKDTAHPVNQETRTKFEKTILEAYEATGEEDKTYIFNVEDGNLVEAEEEFQ